MVESLAQKLQINVSSSKAANDAEPAPQEELYDDVNSRGMSFLIFMWQRRHFIGMNWKVNCSKMQPRGANVFIN